MIHRVLSIFFFVMTATSAACESHIPALSDADCALLNAHYGLTPSSCASPDIAPAGTMAASTSSPAEPAHSPQLTDEMRQNHVFFLAGGSALDDSARAQLVELIALLSKPNMTSACLRLVGHSDISGSAVANRILSKQRAQMVSTFLSAVLGSLRIAKIEGVGFDEPLQDFAVSAAENRRVAIYLGPCRALSKP